MQFDIMLNVVNIQRYSLHDGSGIRTTVFLKGCPLRCRWCCNPETQNCFCELMFSQSKCICQQNCGFCIAACSVKAITFSDCGIAMINRFRCNECQRCVENCPSQALHTAGKLMSVQSVVELALKDSAFYRSGGGGLTLSGGEPLAQKGAIELLKEAKQNRLRTSVETCGYVPQSRLIEAAQFLDEIFFDVKTLNSEKHLEYTGKSNELILSNLRAIAKTFPTLPIMIRTPVIPGFNDSADEIASIRDFINSLGDSVKLELLKYHKMGKSKYQALQREYVMGEEELDEELYLSLIEVANL